MISTMGRPSVFLLDDHEVVRVGMENLLERNGIQVAGSSGLASAASGALVVLRPDMAVLDDRLPDGFGTQVCNAIGVIDPSIRCVLLAEVESDVVLIESILSGAWGCLSKADSAQEHLRLIRVALDGRPAYSRGFERSGSPGREDGHTDRVDLLLSLTGQERRIALHVTSGLSNREIGQKMALSEKTVKNIVSVVLAKMGVPRRTRLAVTVLDALDDMGDQAPFFIAHGALPDASGEIAGILAGLMRSDPQDPRPTEADRRAQTLRLADALIGPNRSHSTQTRGTPTP